MPGEEGSQNQELLDTIPTLNDGTSTPPDNGDAGTPADGGTPPQGGTQDGEGQPPKTALEAAERVMRSEAKGASPAPDKPQDGKPAAPHDPKAAADAQLPFKDHPRWKEVTSENRILKVAKEKNETAIKELEPKAQTYDDLSGFLRESNLGQQDFAQLLAIGAAVKNDPFKAYEMLQPIMANLEEIVGERLPQDLANAVAAGGMTEDAAKAIAKARAEATVAKSQHQSLAQRQQQDAQQRAAQEAEQRAEGAVQSVVSYVEMWAKRDPDAAKKRPLVEDQVEMMLRRDFDAVGKIPTQEEARDVVAKAVGLVNERIRAFGGGAAPRAKTGDILPDGGNPPNSGRPVPKTSLEAAQLALTGGN